MIILICIVAYILLGCLVTGIFYCEPISIEGLSPITFFGSILFWPVILMLELGSWIGNKILK